MSRDLKNQFLIFMTLFIALYIDSYLFSSNLQTIKPTFVLLTLIYWNMALPDRVGITAAVSFGIFVDLIEGSLLGFHGILFVFIKSSNNKAHLCIVNSYLLEYGFTR